VRQLARHRGQDQGAEAQAISSISSSFGNAEPGREDAQDGVREFFNGLLALLELPRCAASADARRSIASSRPALSALPELRRARLCPRAEIEEGAGTGAEEESHQERHDHEQIRGRYTLRMSPASPPWRIANMK